MLRKLGAWAGTLVVASILGPVGTPCAEAQVAATPSELLRGYVLRLRDGAEVRIGDDYLAAGKVLPPMYERGGYRLLWTDPRVVDQLLVALDASYEEGLDPDDYHLPELVRRRDSLGEAIDPDPIGRVEWDLLMSDALVRLELHLRFGKVDPTSVDPSWDFLGARSSIARQDEAVLMYDAIVAGGISDLLARARPQTEAYDAMRSELARLRAVAAAGGWPTMPGGPTLNPGDSDIRIMLLRSRLAATGEFVSIPVVDPTVFDAAVLDGVREFQRRHNIGVDGVVGPRTVEALAASPQHWIDQLRVNLERARWIRSRFENGVIVDIAGFDARYLRDGQVVWRARVAVGTPYRSTPVLSAKIRTLVLNPTWTVPPTILEEDILPEARRDPGYLDQRGLRVFDNQGTPIDNHAIDWNAFPGGAVPYTLRQGPGETNPLGRIKFLFPNPHFVYLHDTPSRGQFARADRAASSGCIRIERPLELASLLVEGMPGWNRARLDEAIASGVTKVVSLQRPVPVYLLYSTATVTDDGELHFSRDIYGRDNAVLAALDRGYRSGHVARPTERLQ